MTRRHYFAALVLAAATNAFSAIIPLPGSSPQQVAGDGTIPNPISVQVVNDAGVPVAGASVRYQILFGYGFSPDSGASCYPDVGLLLCRAITDANGRATLIPMRASTQEDTHLWLSADTGIDLYQRGYPLGTCYITLTAPDTPPSLENMWWTGPAEAGWGLSVIQQRDKLFTMVFTYDDSGKPTWYVLSDGAWSNGVGSQWSGTFHSARGSPYYSYDVSRFTLTPLGTMTLAFNGTRQGTFAANFNSPDPSKPRGVVDKSVQPFDFASGDPTLIRGVGDIWWGGAQQAGWGISIIEQPGILFLIWFTYDDSGAPIWYEMSDGQWTSGTTFEGRIARTSGSPWLNAAYDVSKFAETDVGSFKLSFNGGGALFEYNLDGHSGRLDLTRFKFR